MLPLDDGQADPSHAEHAGEMAVREESRVAVQSFEASDQPIGPRRDLGRCVTARASVGEDVPARSILDDLGGAQTS